MAEDGDFTPAHWGGGGHGFESAYRAYDAHAGRSYETAKKAGKRLSDLLPKKISTNSPSPLVIVVDETSSMGEWPKIMFSKLPYLELEAQEYLGKDMEISWCAIGDAYENEDYPVQARPFTKGTKLKDALNEIVIERGGGSGINESYESGALYLAHNVEMPKAVKPICIFIGDEKPYDIISAEMAEEYSYVKLQKRMTTAEVFEQLKAKFAVYLIRKPYGDGDGNSMTGTNGTIYRAWEKLLGADHISDLPDPKRVVDSIFGILAKETGRIPYFRKELEDRQLPDKGGEAKVKTVYEALKTIHASDGSSKPGDSSGHSRTTGISHGKRAKPLM